MNKPSSLLLVALPCFAACAGQSYRVDVAPFFGRASGEVALQNSAGSLAGFYQNDLDGDLNLGDTEPSPYVRLQWDKERHRVRLHGFALDSDSSGVLTQDYGNIAAGTPVSTSTEFFAVAGNWGYQLVRGEHYRLAIGAQASFYSLDVAARSAGGREEVETSVVVPMPFAEAEAILGPVTIGANFAVMSVDLGDADGRYVDTEAYVRWSVARDFDFLGGYRYIVIDAHGEATGRDFDADVEVQGLFVGAGLRF